MPTSACPTGRRGRRATPPWSAVPVAALAVLLFAAPGCAEDLGHAELAPEVAVAALTAEQCTYFAEGDRITICKATPSPRNPFVVIRTSVAACINAFADMGDGSYVAHDDPTCEGLGCFPEGAPYDGTVPCCDGLGPDASGACADVDACEGHPCDVDATCTDLPAPAPDSPEGRVCACDEGFEGSGEPGDCAPASGFLLDIYPGASAAFSLRKLRAAYDGPAFLVRRSFDDAQMEIGFDEEGDLDRATLVDFVRSPYGDTVEWPEVWNATAQQYSDAGIGNGYVVRWYDQSEDGAGRYAFQNTRVEQHGVAMAGMYVGAVQTFFENRSKMGMRLNRTLIFGTAFALARVQSVTTINYLAYGHPSFIGDGVSGGFFFHGTHSGFGMFGLTGGNDVSIGDMQRNLGYFNNATGTAHVAKNGGPAVALGAVAPSITVSHINGRHDWPSLHFRGRIKEIVFYDFDQGPNKEGIEDHINEYFSVY